MTLLVGFIAATSSHLAFATQPVVAVFDIENAAGLAAADITSLTDLTSALVSASSSFKVAPGSELKKALEDKKAESLSACYDQACQIEIGKEIAAAKSLSTKISRMGEQCMVTMQLFDLREGASERGSVSRGGCDAKSLLASVEKATKELLDAKASATSVVESPTASVVPKTAEVATQPSIPAKAEDAPKQKSSPKWEIVSSDDTFVTKRRSVPGSNKFAFRGEMVADITMGKLLKVFLSPESRKEWVALYKDSQNLIMPTPFDLTYWIRFGLPWPISDRDYVLRAIAKADRKNRLFTTMIESVEHPEKPKQDCCVRGQAFGTYYRFQALPGQKKVKMEVEVHTDPKGALPSWLVNLVQKSWPRDTLKGLLKEAQKPDVTPDPDYVGWHN